ncbi:uncharacterized protein A1O5_05748 [Cladophialophora psammophila CBS 110553]|uniref:Uncharacterized protein n=1 Tax=Cladophialophora psammophila CBS 110553 TaxID=1182543 RepID=W9WS46_9EURO|nr:uncharacterized protein A1O5_05748 [Cladophialophora psammophila CBS 110553]EXJ70758.1 hypothetical protein A1O5_05748 [Cladophialophora psammophila CBS 110553]
MVRCRSAVHPALAFADLPTSLKSSRIFRRRTDDFAASLVVPEGRRPAQSPLNTSSIDDHDTVDEKGPLGLNLLYTPSEPLIDLVFVHGLGGGSKKTWSLVPSLYWPKEWLPKDAAFKNVRIHSFGYNSDYVKSRNNCWTIQRFGQSLLGDLRTSPSLGESDTPLIMIGHSMGGLVIKRAYMLAKHDPSLQPLTTRFRAMYFLATPHQGSDWAKVLDRMLNAFSLAPEFVEELEKGSGALQSINEEFRHYFDQFELVSFYETQSMKYLGSRIVEPESGVLNLPREKQVPMAADHRSICKFQKPTDQNYVELRNSLARTVANICDERAKGKEGQRNRELSDLKKYLRISHQPEDDLELVEGSRLSGTCEWIAKKESYLAWRDFAADAPTILWINGKPATGKSVLAGYVITQLRQRKSSCSYYFFKHGEKSKSRLVNCLRSLAFQMACENDQVRRRLNDLHKEDGQLDGETERSVWRKIFVSTIFRIQMEPHYWVIDGLDECEGSETFIESLIGQLDPTANLKILVTGRDMPKLKAAFLNLGPHRYCGLEISTADTVEDIKTAIKAKSHCLTVKDDELRAALLGKVLEKSQGSFLWTLLVLEELANTYGEAELKKVLDEVPRDMNLLYQRVLDSMKLTTTEGGRRVAKAILKWVSCAMRPLSTEELTGALNLDLGDKYDALEEMIPKLCGQLVAVDKFGNVQIVHETVREYLTSDDLQSDFAVNKSQSHTRIAEICLNYLASDEMRPSTARRRGPRQGSVLNTEDSRIKFSRYACIAFSHHLANANCESVDILILVSKFLESNILSWIEGIAQTRILTPIIRAAKDIRTYVKKCNAPPIGKEIQTIRASTTDLVRLVAKFSDALTAVPAAIYTLIPPFCPRNSTLYKAGIKCRTTRLSITGLSCDHWDDRLTCIDLQNDEFTSIAYGDELFAVGTTSGVVTIYNATSCEEYKILNHGEALRLLHFKPKSDVLVSCGLRKLTVWNSRTGDAMYEFQAPFRPIALDFDNDTLVVASRRNFLRSWDLKNNATLQQDRPWSHSDEDIQRPSRLQPCAISLSTGHQKMAVAYIGQPITIWDLCYDEYYGSCGKMLANGETSKHLVTSLSFNPNPDIRLLAVSYLDGQLVLLDPFEGKELESFRANCRALISSPNGRLLGGVAASETIHIYEFDTLRLLYRIRSSELGIKQLAFSRDNFRFADIRRSQCNIWEPTMLLCDSVADDRSESTSASVIEATTSDDKVRINTMVLHNQGQVIICGKDDGSVCLHDARTGSFLQTLHEHKSQVRILTWQTRNNITMSVDTSNAIHASVLSKDLKGGWVSDQLPFQSRLNCGHAIVQVLHSEVTNRLILSTRECDYLWGSEGKELAARPYPKNPGIRLWIQHPQSQFHAICIEGATARIFSWDDWSQVSSLGLAISMAGMQLKSFRGYGSGHRRRMLLELSELNGSSRTRGLYLFDATLFNLESDKAPRSRPDPKEDKTIGLIDVEIPPLQLTPSREDDKSLIDSVAEKATQNHQKPAADPLFGPQLNALTRYVSHVIHLNDSGKLVFLDSHSWVSSIDLEDFAKFAMATPAASGPPSPPIRYSRHFFVPYDWFSGTRDIVCAATMRDVLFARNGEIAIIKNGLDYAEEVAVGSL